MVNRVAKIYTRTCRCGNSFTTTNIEQIKCPKCNRKGKTYKIHKTFSVLHEPKIVKKRV